jgi:hypothetical protein
MATSLMGTLTRKIQRQEIDVVRIPPKVGCWLPGTSTVKTRTAARII